jgi:8-oxo-dGTP diphosphatase
MREYSLGAAAIIRDETGRVLLVKHNYGRLNWELPGGSTEANESVLDTVRREVREETGLEVEAERLSGIYYEPDIDFHHFVFICSSVGNRKAIPDKKEITDCQYWPANALP